MIERKSNIWIKRGLHGLAIAGLVAASITGRDKSADAAVGSLRVTPFHEVLVSGQLSDRPWDERSMWSPIVDNPQMKIEVDEPFDRKNIPPVLNLETIVTVEGEAEICARNYPPSGECRPIRGTDVSNYLFYTNALSPTTYFRVGSTSLEIKNGPGKYTEVMKLTVPNTPALVASASATLNVPKITRLVFPLVLKGTNREIPKLRTIAPVQEVIVPKLDQKGYLPSIRQGAFRNPTSWEIKRLKRAA